MEYGFILDLAIIAVTTKIFVTIVKKLHLPQVVGFLIAGLVLGPACFNIVQKSDFLSSISELGVITILFMAGMGTNVKDLKNSGKAGMLVAVCGVVVPMVCGAALALICAKLGLIPETKLVSAIFVGTVLTATSVSITVETLKELGKLRTEVGNTILAAALIDDVLGLVVLTIVCSVAGESTNILLVLVKIVLFFVFAFVVGYAACMYFRHLDKKEGSQLRQYPILAYALCLVMAYCAETVFGVADIIGAYAAGLAISCTKKAEYTESRFAPINYIVFEPVFFVCVGLKADLGSVTGGTILFSVLLLAVAILSKLVGCGLGGRVCGFNVKDSIRIGCGMACRGEVALIVANRGMSMGVVDEALMTPTIIMVIGCAVLTPIMLKMVFTDSGKVLTDVPLAERAELHERLDMRADEILSEKKKK